MRSSTVLMPARLRQLNDARRSQAPHGHFKHLIVLRFSLFNNGGLGADFLGQVYEQIEVVAQNLRAERNRVACVDGCIGPYLERQLVIVGQVAYTGVFNPCSLPCKPACRSNPPE